MDKPRVIDKVLFWVILAVFALFVVSSAIIIPITVRGYYFLHAHILDIPGSSGYSMDEIRLAFNDVMDFIWLGKEFKTGNLAWSEEGKSHFQDCVPLFWLDLIVFLATTFLLIGYILLVKFNVIRPYRLFGLPAWTYAAFLLLAAVMGIAIYGLVDFDGLFVAFHALFFPGKDNWMFNPTTDEVINILPETFFACCGAFIGSVAFLQCGGAIAYGFVSKAKARRHHQKKA